MDTFIAEHENQDINFENCPTNSCMTLMHAYIKEVLGLEDPLTLASPLADQVWTNFDTLVGHEHFEKIENTPDNIPLAGDIVVFKATQNTPEGHVCLFISGDANTFTSFEANYPLNTQPHKQNHQYVTHDENHVIIEEVAGWLRYIPPQIAEVPGEVTTYKGLDLTNKASVEAAIDTWSEVVNGIFVRKTDLTPLYQALGLDVTATIDQVLAKINEYKSVPTPTIETLPHDQKNALLEGIKSLLHFPA